MEDNGAYNEDRPSNLLLTIVKGNVLGTFMSGGRI